MRRQATRRSPVTSVSALAVITIVLAAGPTVARAATFSVGPITDVSSSCSGQNAEVEQATAPKLGYVYELWMGCRGIGFARSTNGGASYGKPISLYSGEAWDPAIAVSPSTGTVYAAFMRVKGNQYYPVVAASFDHGATFPQVTSLTPPKGRNWGDRDFIAVGPENTVYVTWDYGPERNSISYICSARGSCSFGAGDLNIVLQKSTNEGRTFGAMSNVSPGFPAGGADSAPLVVDLSTGRIDVLYQGYQVTNPKTFTLGPGYSYFTSSSNGGSSWSAPVRVGAQAGTMSPAEWWIDGDIALDEGGNLYATWDTQGTNPDGSPNDIGWLSYSTDHGQSWSTPVQAPADRSSVPHIIQVAGADAGNAYIGWLSPSNPLGYAQYLRAFSLSGGWSSAPVQISSEFGEPSVWPGDTFGISVLSPEQLVLSWGSATPPGVARSQIFAARVGVALP